MKAYSYIRFSTPEQAKGDSLRRQLELSKRYAEKHGLELDEKLRVDSGISGFNGDNLKPDSCLAQFLSEIERGKVQPGSYLLIESLDRLSRQAVQKALRLFLQIIEQGVHIVTLSDGRVFKNETLDSLDLITSIMVMVRAHEESAIKSSRLSAAWEKKRSELQERKATATCPAWLRLSDDRKEFHLIPDRVAVLNYVFDLAESGYGNHAIAKKLNLSKTPTFGRSSVWHNSYIQKTLTNKAVIGIFQPQKIERGKRVNAGDEIPNYYPAVIDRNRYFKILDDREMRRLKGRGRKGKHNSNLFSGLLSCYRCGSPIRYIDKGNIKKAGQPYLICRSALLDKKCNAEKIRYPDFEKQFISHIRGIDYGALSASYTEASAISSMQKDLSGLKADLKQKKTQASNLIDAIKNSKASSLILSEIEKIESECEGIRTAILSAEHDIEQKRISIDSWDNHVRNSHNVIESLVSNNKERELSRFQAAQTLRSLINKIYVGKSTAGANREIDEIFNDYLPEEEDINCEQSVILKIDFKSGSSMFYSYIDGGNSFRGSIDYYFTLQEAESVLDILKGTEIIERGWTIADLHDENQISPSEYQFLKEIADRYRVTLPDGATILQSGSDLLELKEFTLELTMKCFDLLSEQWIGNTQM